MTINMASPDVMAVINAVMMSKGVLRTQLIQASGSRNWPGPTVCVRVQLQLSDRYRHALALSHLPD